MTVYGVLGKLSPRTQPHQSGSMKTTLLAALVPCVVIVIILAVLLGAYVIRHRRLQNSFASFANSHYNRRSGTTTFSADGDLGRALYHSV